MDFRNRGTKGLLFMLQAYLDDSGTHDGAPVLVVGGLIGTPASWDSFETKWGTLLLEPLPGKSPVKAFHLSHIVGHFGEFQDYKPAEVDLLRFELRKIILESDLLQISTTISLPDWYELVVPPFSDVIGTPEELCFSGIVINSLELLHSHGITDKKIAFVYDIGRKTPQLERLFRRVENPEYRPQVSSISWGQANDVLPLQAADFIANENYRAATEWLETGDVESPHFKRLIESAGLAFILGRKEIQAEIDRRRPDGLLR